MIYITCRRVVFVPCTSRAIALCSFCCRTTPAAVINVVIPCDSECPALHGNLQPAHFLRDTKQRNALTLLRVTLTRSTDSAITGVSPPRGGSFRITGPNSLSEEALLKHNYYHRITNVRDTGRDVCYVTVMLSYVFFISSPSPQKV